MPVYYATAAQLRDELEVDALTLPDARAEKLITDAEDLIDTLLGFWRVNETTGRKIVQADVEAWQFTKLTRATVLTAANIYRNPAVLTSPQWDEVKGPDFWFVGRIGGPLAQILSPVVLAVLEASTLRRMSGRSRAGSRSVPPWYPFSYNIEDYG